jgi:hypothetical protein
MDSAADGSPRVETAMKQTAAPTLFMNVDFMFPLFQDAAIRLNFPGECYCG